MGRPDWRAMLAGMTSTEYADWRHFYRTHYFQDTQLDMHFSGLMYAVLSLFFCDPDMHPSDFSLLAPRREEAQTEMPDEDDMLDMMLHGGERVKEENLGAVLDWYSAQR